MIELPERLIIGFKLRKISRKLRIAFRKCRLQEAIEIGFILMPRLVEARLNLIVDGECRIGSLGDGVDVMKLLRLSWSEGDLDYDHSTTFNTAGLRRNSLDRNSRAV